MAFCSDCGTKLPSDAGFCPGCGLALGEKPKPTKEENSAQLLADGKADYEAMREKIRQDAKRSGLGCIPFLVIIIGVSVYLYDVYPVLTLVGVLLPISIALQLYKPNRWLVADEYYSLRGSRDSKGHHRCVFCGAGGIYRHGEYKSSNTFAKCSKCQAGLYVE
jgi:hypothetical protein